MGQVDIPIESESIPLREAAEALSQTLPFAGADLALLAGVHTVDRLTVKAGALLVQPHDPIRSYWVVLDGEIRADRPESDGSMTTVGFARSGEGFGEAPLLAGKPYSPFAIEAVRDTTVVRFSEEAFWTLMACCPQSRKVILDNMAQRLQAYQVEALHREKLISLGTLAAGLMHELHNPGSAAKRAATQLRQNLLRLQQLSLRFSDHPKTEAQLECMRNLLEHTLSGCHGPAMSSMEQSDAEEAMAEWLAAAGVENAYRIAPALVGIGLPQQDLACAKNEFDQSNFSDALNWLEALVSSVTLVCTIEEGITRVSELVMAVKKFAYDERSVVKQLDVHENLQSTLTILGHKLRMKSVVVEKQFAAAPPLVFMRGSSLSQVWTNLIDNAVDASPEGGKIKIATWTEPAPAGSGAANGAVANGIAPHPGTRNGTATAGAALNADTDSPRKSSMLAVAIEDQGSGIPPEVLPHIFEAFFTTKPQGSGTGLGLEIVHRIVTQKFGGTIEVESQPGKTRFIVRLPMEKPPEPASSPINCLLPSQP